MDDDLRERWAALVGRSESAARHGRDLLDRWSEPHRHYHSIGHLHAVLDAVDLLAPEARHPDTVRIAAWFHDAVYNGRPGDDEAASAELAAARLPELGVAPVTVTEVTRLVLLTASHDPDPDDADGATLCDADLAVLGGDAERYAAYVAAVRRDYAHIAEDDFREGRIAVLERLQAMDPLFRTRLGRDRWDTAARRNLGAELAHLRSLR